MHFSPHERNNFRNVLIDEISLREYGAEIMNIPPPILPERNVETIYVPGRSGRLTLSDGSYKEVTYPVTLFFDKYEQNAFGKIREGKFVVFSNQPRFKFAYRVDDEILQKRLLLNWREVVVPFICHPEKMERDPTVLVNPTTLRNDGNRSCRPSFALYGSGDVTVSLLGQKFVVQGVRQKAFIDGENFEVWIDGKRGDQKALGDYLEITAGKQVDLFVTNAESWKVWPNWRWI